MKILCLLTIACAGTLLATPAAEAKPRRPLPPSIRTNQICSDPKLAAALLARMGANREVRVAVLREMRRSQTWRSNDDYIFEHPVGGG